MEPKNGNGQKKPWSTTRSFNTVWLESIELVNGDYAYITVKQDATDEHGIRLHIPRATAVKLANLHAIRTYVRFTFCFNYLVVGDE